jgi:serine protease Do
MFSALRRLDTFPVRLGFYNYQGSRVVRRHRPKLSFSSTGGPLQPSSLSLVNILMNAYPLAQPLPPLVIVLASLSSWGAAWAAPEEIEPSMPVALSRIYDSGTPETLEDLRLMDAYQRQLVRKVASATVGVQIGATQGSGVIISPEGYVLTAAHVAGTPKLEVSVIFPDGQRHRGRTLGMNKNLDAGLIKLDPPQADQHEGPWPSVDMGHASDLRPGSWCLALGHPGGYQPGREPVARFGRVLVNRDSVIETDCILVGGDSGGPLFDMEGKVVGVHSRIGSHLTKNLHVPVEAYRADWDRLAGGESWGSLLSVIGRPIIGVLGDRDSDEPRISQVLPASPAEAAGLQPGDLIVRFGGEEVQEFKRLKELVDRRQPGDEVVVEVRRGDETREFRLIVGALGGS